MDKQALLERVKCLWPHAITLRPDGGQEALNSIYWPIEEKLDADSDEWMKLSAWAFHQALWNLANAKTGAGCNSLRPADVTLETFDHWMKENLSDDSWSEFRREYDETLD